MLYFRRRSRKSFESTSRKCIHQNTETNAISAVVATDSHTAEMVLPVSSVASNQNINHSLAGDLGGLCLPAVYKTRRLLLPIR